MSQNVEEIVKDLGSKAKKASLLMSNFNIDKKNKALENIAYSIKSNKDVILRANEKDLNNAMKNNLDHAKIDQ